MRKPAPKDVPNKLKLKRRGTGLRIETHKGTFGTYLLLQKGQSVHAFLEVEAKAAARDCGAEGPGTPLHHWNEVRRKGAPTKQ